MESERVFGAYEEEAPLADGWERRVGPYPLLPLLVHALLFGDSYRPSAESTALRYPLRQPERSRRCPAATPGRDLQRKV